MLSCDACRPLIPDLLYGLLDAPEAAAVSAHLDGCPACAAARDEAGRVQGLIAAAARDTFPAVRFDPPAGRPKAAPSTQTRRTAIVPFPDPAARAATPTARPAAGGRSVGGRWLPWAVAAAVLVAVPGTVFPVLNLLNRAETARADAARAAAEAEQARRDLDRALADADRPLAGAELKLLAAQQEHDAWLGRWVAAEKAVAQAADARKLTWDVRKPAAVQPGAPNEFLLVVRDPGTGPAGKLVAEVRDQTDAVVHSQPIDAERLGDHTVRLPAAAWKDLTPQSELYLTVARVDEKTGAKTDLPDRVRLLGPVYATALTTDKATYRPGETVYFRSLTLDRVTLTPPAREQVLRYELHGPGGHPVRDARPVAGSTDLLRVTGPAVEPVRGPGGGPLRGVGSGAIALPADAPDGDYTLVLRETPAPGGGPPAVPFPVTRAVKVRSGAAEAFRKQIGYAAASYAPGETVEARAELRFGDDPVAGAEVKAVATADGRALTVVGGPVTGADGTAVFRFALPADLDKADVRLKATFKARSGKELVEEVVAAPVPVVGRAVAVEFFPEGGDLVAGVPCRVYVRATTPAGHPVDVRGVVTDGRRELARVETLTDPAGRGANRGIGSFTFTPELGVPVWLKLSSPAARFPAAPAAVAGAGAAATRTTGFLLPKVKDDGVVMTVPDPVTSPGQPIRVHVRSVGQDRKLVVGAYTRGRLSDTQRVTAAAGQLAEVRLMAGTDPRGGVVRVTVFEERDDPKADLHPAAERLVFRRPGEALNLQFAATGKRSEGFLAGDRVDLALTATDEKGSPAAAVLYAAAVNTAAAPGHTDRLPTTHFLLAGEVNTPDALEHADFLLTDHPRAAEALDGVLATQGWRRFAEQSPAAPGRRLAEAEADRRELQVNNGQWATWEPGWAREQQRVRGEYLPRYKEAVEALEAAKAGAEAARAAGPGDVSAARSAAARAAADAADAAGRADAAAVPVGTFRATGWYAVGGLGLLALLLGGAAVVRPGGRFPLGVGTVGAVGLAAFLVVALGTAGRLQARPADEPAAEAVAVAPAPRPADPPRLAAKAAAADGPVEFFAPGKGDALGLGEPPAGAPAVWQKDGRPPVFRPGDLETAKAGPVGPKSPGGKFGEPGRGRPEIPLTALARADAARAPRGAAPADPVARADDLRKAQDQANEYARDKATVVREQLNAALRRDGYFAGAAPAGPQPGVVGRMTAPSAEAVAVLRVRSAVPEVPPLVVREYAAPRPGPGPSADPGDTVLWRPVIVLPTDGKANLHFHLGGAPGGYEVIVAGHTLDGRVGAVRGVIPVAPPAPPVPAAP